MFQDRKQILRRAGMNTSDEMKQVKIMNSMESVLKINPKELSTKEWTAFYFSKLEKNEKDGLRHVYKLDFEMFSYDPYMYD